MIVRYLELIAKCNDMCQSRYYDENNELIKDNDGNVPYIESIGGGGDYINITIDLQTGTIVNWQPPSQEELIDSLGS